MRHFALLVVAFATLSGQAVAAEVKAFTPAALQAAQTAGKPIVVDVSADWCSTCVMQTSVVQTLLKKPKFKDLVLFKLDYDRQKAAMRNLHVRERSTFVVFKGTDEKGRSTGDTNKSSIEKLFDKTS